MRWRAGDSRDITVTRTSIRGPGIVGTGYRRYGSADDFDVELPRTTGSRQHAYPHAHEQLRAAGRGQVAQIEHVGPAEGSQDVGYGLFGLRVVGRHEDGMVAAGQLPGVHHEVRGERIERLDHPGLREL